MSNKWDSVGNNFQFISTGNYDNASIANFVHYKKTQMLHVFREVMVSVGSSDS